MKKLKNIFADILKAAAAGAAAGAVISLLLLAGGYLFGSFKLANALEAMKDGMLLLAAIFMFIVAGMLLIKGKDDSIEEKKESKNGWRRHFKVIGLKTVLITMCVIWLIFASIADYILLRM